MTALPAAWTIRPIDIGDLDVVCDHRRRLFEEAGWPDEKIGAMGQFFRLWLADQLSLGSYEGFLAEHGTRVIGGVGMMELAWPPHPRHPSDARRGYILNLFVERVSRGAGLGAQLMQRCEREFGRRGIRYLVLHATAAGRPLYERLGWSGTVEMGKTLGGES